MSRLWKEADLDSNPGSFKSHLILSILFKPHGLTTQLYHNSVNVVNGGLDRTISNNVLYCALPICIVTTMKISSNCLASILIESKVNHSLFFINLVFTFLYNILNGIHLIAHLLSFIHFFTSMHSF